MRGHSAKRAAKAAEAKRPAARAKGAARSSEVVERGLRARIATLEAQALRHETAIDIISPGICFFDGEQRVILCNRRYTEIYRLAPEQVRPGMTLREIVELRVAAGTSAMDVDGYLAWSASINSSGVAKTWAAELKDGRTIHIRHQPLPDGGWVAAHEDVTELEATRAVANERLSLQALIDCLPDNLWVKDVKSRFVIANQVTATRMGFAGPADLIGNSDLELLAPEIAYKFYADEQQIVRSGRPMIDMEECVFGASGDKTWILTTKVPLRNERNEIFGVAGISRDITERKAAADERLSLQALIDCLPDNLWVKDVKSRFVIANQVTATRIGAPSPAALYGKTDLELLPPEISYKFYADEQKIVRSGQPLIDMEEYVFGASGGKTWILTTKVPLRNERGEVSGVAGISRDITERKLADALRDGQSLILEMIATGAPLQDVLENLVHLMESQLQGIVGSILLLDEAGRRLRHGAAPSLPEAYVKAIDGVPIGPRAGSCGTAAYRRESVVVADVMTDPLWADYKDLAAEHGLRSCWSSPILSRQGAVLGTFALYSKSVREPTEAEIRLVDAATRIAGIAIERQQADDRIDSMAHSDKRPGLKP